MNNTRIKVAGSLKPVNQSRGSTLEIQSGQLALLINLNYVQKEGEPYRSTLVISTGLGNDTTFVVGEAVRWLNRELRTTRDLATGLEKAIPDEERFPRVVTNAEDPRLPMIPSTALKRSEAEKYQATLVRFGAIHFQDVENCKPFYKHVANLKRKADGTFEKVADNI